LRHPEKGDTDLLATFGERTTDQYNETVSFVSTELNQNPDQADELARPGRMYFARVPFATLIFALPYSAACRYRSAHEDR
jgi:hypothetical protein